MTNTKEKFDQLIEDGFCIFEKVLDAVMLAQVRQVSDHLLDDQAAEHFEAQKSTGSMVSVYDNPFFARLVAHQPALDALAFLGYPAPRWSSGFVISKPPQAPPLFWHQDWWGWNDPVSYTDKPQQLFLMYYLVDTHEHNGCLRVIKGSHRARHAMHDAVPEAHTDDLRRATDPTHPAFQPLSGDMAVPVKAGDLVIGDSRLLHGAYANQSDERRTVITLWYHPAFDSSPDPIKANLSLKQTRANAWPPEAYNLVKPLVPTYEGDVEPLAWNRVPGPMLR
ncbi:MAG: phytanoyl-CoA dioxygenase family protein [Chloroflexota bacterium]